MNATINKGDLNFKFDNGQFYCEELAQLPEAFNTAYGSGTVLAEAIDHQIELVAKNFELRCADDAAYKAMPEAERKSRGMEIFQPIVSSIKESLKDKSPFDQLMHWLGMSWWYCNDELTAQLRNTRNSKEHWDNASRLVEEMILPLLHPQIQREVAGMKARNTAVGFGHFAVLFDDGSTNTRRIVTDTQLFELRGASGYVYLDITADGKPVARYCVRHGGERAFFDGVHLMTHDKFQTCAPATVISQAGYKVNSTRCTIINGCLYPLIDIDDKVAHTTGAFMGMVDWSLKEFLASRKMAEVSANQLCLQQNGNVLLNGKVFKPFGMFMPSRLSLLDSGFALCEPSEFLETSNIHYAKVMVVDDLQTWIDKISLALGEGTERGPESLVALCTTDKRSALTEIMATNPDALILDVHLTMDEEFDGLWIARQLLKNGFGGLILLASSYEDEALQAMLTLVGKNRQVQAPGKNPDRIRKILSLNS